MAEFCEAVAAESFEACAFEENLVVFLGAQRLDCLAVETKVNLISNSRSNVQLKGS